MCYTKKVKMEYHNTISLYHKIWHQHNISIAYCPIVLQTRPFAIFMGFSQVLGLLDRKDNKPSELPCT